MDVSEFNVEFEDKESLEVKPLENSGSTCDTFEVRYYGKRLFQKRLKQEYSSDSRYQQLFKKEFETGIRLEHPSLVRYLMMGKDKDGTYIMMDFIEGQQLTKFCKSNPDYFKNSKNVERFVLRILEGLRYLHSNQVLHLDIKPDNIIITNIGHEPKIIDLGFCRTDVYNSTRGATFAYAAPEQIEGGIVDERTDIYLFGILLKNTLNSPSRLYRKIINKCTARKREDRFQSAEKVIQYISDYKKRNRILKGCLTAIALIILVGLGLKMTDINVSSSSSTNVITDSTLVIPAPAVQVSESDTTTASNKNEDKVIKTEQHKSKVSPSEQMKKALRKELDKVFKVTLLPFRDPQMDSKNTEYNEAQQEFTEGCEAARRKIQERYSNVSDLEIDNAYTEYVNHLLLSVVPQRMQRLIEKEKN